MHVSYYFFTSNGTKRSILTFFTAEDPALKKWLKLHGHFYDYFAECEIGV